MVRTKSSVPVCCKLSVHASHKLLMSCIMSSVTTSLLTLYGYMKCQSSEKKLNLTNRKTKRVRGGKVLLLKNTLRRKNVSSWVICLIYSVRPHYKTCKTQNHQFIRFLQIYFISLMKITLQTHLSCLYHATFFIFFL